MENKKHILFISSWYPNRNDRTHGIFNRSFAEAAALHNRVSVLHVCSDETINTEMECVRSNDNDIDTCMVYYKKITSTFPGISQWQKHRRLIRAFELGYQQLFANGETPDLIQLNVIMPAGLGV